ncbi:Rcs stress response system protein RcsF [Litorilituus lipolyticus]|uniref:RcsF protein n=1 Tax=Litorilituus lipolyticus TaxID=2491017 RepID=A0A502KMH0_9GAMM|nr:Rcs stress response system protein RcsF [Litorilituus lipolyticus]TPH12870.1 rcsF protein [Litorilituus lipolyticus]
MKNKIILTIFTSITLLSSCSSNYVVSTNLDKENFDHYFSASKVKIYDKESELPGPYKFVGLVEGQDCQAMSHQAQPDKINARTQARQQAYQHGANAIVFSGCALLDSEKLSKLNASNDAKQCHAIIICYARAFKTKDIK